MKKLPLTRRGFVAGCAVAGATAACAGGAPTAFAAGGDIGASARPESRQVHTICQGCPNACGYTAYMVEGELGKVIGDAWNPRAAGTLCARGFGYTQSAFSSSNVDNPKRRKANGGFKTISWDEALTEIGDAITAIRDEYGPEALALAYDGTSPTATAYGTRLMEALGSGNVFVDDAVWNAGKAAAFSQVIGVGEYVPDIARADLVLMIDASFADVTTPDLAAALQDAREAGTPIVAVDPRLGALGSFASEWLPVNPGTELALLLAVCNEMIRTGRYDKDYVAANAAGFDEWAEAIAPFTAIWAEGVTGVQSYRIEELASKLHAAAPHVAVEYGNGQMAAASYANAGETARVVCLLNMMLGAYGAEGGALLPFDYSDAGLDAAMPYMRAKMAPARAFGWDAYPLAAAVGGPVSHAFEQAATGAIRAMILVDVDAAYDHAAMPGVLDALERLELLVCITQEMTETAELADYILPLAPYLSSGSLPHLLQGTEAAASIAVPVLEGVDTNALPADEIICGLAEACGAGDAFTFTLEEAASAQLEAVGLTLEGVQLDGTGSIDAGNATRVSSWRTGDGKIDCTSAACEAAGLSAVPVWTALPEQSNIQVVISDDMNLGQRNEVLVLVDGDEAEPEAMRFQLISGQQTVVGPRGYNVPELVDIAEKYDLDSVWVNAQVAEVLGIQTGDDVVLSNGNGSGVTKAFVTGRIVPTALYIPSGFGHGSSRQHEVSDDGFDPATLCDGSLEAGYGVLCTQGACVSMTKVGE